MNGINSKHVALWIFGQHTTLSFLQQLCTF